MLWLADLDVRQRDLKSTSNSLMNPVAALLKILLLIFKDIYSKSGESVSTIQETVAKIAEVNSWDQRIAQIRLIPLNHGTNEHPSIYAEIARLLYVPYLAADFAYIHENHFYGREYFDSIASLRK